MKRTITSSFALSVAAASVFAAMPMIQGSANVDLSTLQREATPFAGAPAKAPAGSNNTWTEDFEGRPNDVSWSSQEWLPAGWQDVSKKGNVAPPSAGSSWNLTWQVNTNETITIHNPSSNHQAYEGEAFAYIMADVMWGGRETPLMEQDEWLITPASVPTGEDWLYFKLAYSPGWTVYNRDTQKFDGLTTSLQVYASTDDGATWTKIWDLVDDEIRPNYTEAELSASLSSYAYPYRPIYVSIKPYLNRSTKFAFRYYGSLGQPMAIDNVAVGVPQPVAKYELPEGIFYQGATATFDYPESPKLLVAPETPYTWMNRSTDILTNEWAYSDASGAAATSDVKNLTTPAYENLKVVDTPVLTGFFENRASEPYTLKHNKMQAGGFLTEVEDEAAVGTYNIFDGKLTVSHSSSPIYTLCPTIDDAWETRLGKLPNALDILGFGVRFPQPTKAYGFDFAEIGVIVDEKVADDAAIEVRVLTTDEMGRPKALIGLARLTGKEIQANSGDQVVLRFNFPVPVYTDESIMVFVSGLRGEGDGAVKLPFMLSADPTVKTSSFVAINEYDPNAQEEYEWYGDLQTLTYDGYFGGHLIGVNACYSWMEAEGDLNIDAPLEGASKEFTVKAYRDPSHWALTVDGVNPADWAKIESAEYDAATESYKVKVAVLANTKPAKIDTDLKLMSPGSFVTLHVTQPGAPSGICNVAGDEAVSVKVNGNFIEVIGGSSAELFTVSGRLASKTALNGSKTVIDASHLAKGVYVIRIDGGKATKIVL